MHFKGYSHFEEWQGLMSSACRAAAKNFKGKKLEKGVAFPTCISVNK